MTLLLLAVPLLPLIAATIVLVARRRLPGGGGTLVAGATALSLAAIVLLQGEAFTVETTWLTTASVALSVGLELNGLTWFAALLVAGIALPVCVYSVGYLGDEPDRPRFHAELGLFIGAMLTLVLASSFVLLFAAWELVGVASYLLIGFGTRERSAAAAAMKALVMTRAGDLGLLVAWLLLLVDVGTVDIARVLAAAAGGTLDARVAAAAALLLLPAVAGKSAQLPLSMWLPDAMVAPTPVSALLHSATLVAAGAFLLLRLYPLLAASTTVLAPLFWLGAITALTAALIATAAMDLKRLLAWSTVSQLGEMLLAIGLAAPLAAALHLAAHASFKSTLFLAAGSVERRTGTRDLARLRGVARAMPVAAACFVVAALALAGVQPLLTRTSQDALFAAALRAGWPAASIVAIALLLAGVYIGRAAVCLFARDSHAALRAGSTPRTMQVGMIVLAASAATLSLPVVLLPAVLPFAAEPQASWPVRLGALGCSIVGLGFGALRAWRRGAAPALGAFAIQPERHLTAATAWIAHATARVAALVDRLERGWSSAVASAARAGVGAGLRVARAESSFDGTADAIANGAWICARTVERSERSGFGATIDRWSAGVRWTGFRARVMQSGELYLYTLGLTVWTVLVVLAATLALRS